MKPKLLAVLALCFGIGLWAQEAAVDPFAAIEAEELCAEEMKNVIGGQHPGDYGYTSSTSLQKAIGQRSADYQAAREHRMNLEDKAYAEATTERVVTTQTQESSSSGGIEASIGVGSQKTINGNVTKKPATRTTSSQSETSEKTGGFTRARTRDELEKARSKEAMLGDSLKSLLRLKETNRPRW
ncbi:MAG: hypothetical protein KBB32_05450 [Spirochaetia bacterium]|nr:hypothetical protein [Spirochaetia bacterium]